MDYVHFLQKIASFKILIFIVLITLCLSQYYVSFESFQYAAKKEDSPANLNAAVIKGAINLTIAIFASLFILWLAMQRW
jgi:hypothetical protein